ncbi:hypothetical protein PA10_00094 [Pseudomonas phage pPa_SNUABM_DT01]|nr:hypothetical protein PA10_00094 [Pseudomonas phage pPa_SNUABM_DT01]
MSNANTFDNLAVIAGAVDLSVEIVNNLAGNLVSSYLDGAPVNDRTIAAIAAADINNVIEGRDNA